MPRPACKAVGYPLDVHNMRLRHPVPVRLIPDLFPEQGDSEH